MDANEQINKFKEFIESHYYEKLLENIRKDKKVIVIDFSELAKFDHELADLLLDEPEEVIKAAEIAVEQFDLQEKNIKIRFNNLPELKNLLIRNIRSKHLGKFFYFEGVVRQKSDVRPQVTSAKFECPSCGNIINVLQLDQKMREPSRCGCGRKGKFKMLSKELIDAQRLVLEEIPEHIEGGAQPKRMSVFLKEDLVSPLTERYTNPGSRVLATGYVKEVPIIGRDGGKLTRFDLMIEANYVEGVQEDFYEIEITEEEEEKIKEIAKDPNLYDNIVKSVAPSIYGHDKIKEAIAYQLVGGVKKTRADGVRTRGDIHVLLLGDPGSGKCLDGNTKIIREDGKITTIKSFYEENVSLDRDRMKIFSINENGLNFTSQPRRFWRRKAPKKMFKIITYTGNELIVTKEHPLFTTKDGVIFAKEAKDYGTEEYIATPSKIEAEGSLQIVSKDTKKTKANNKVKYDIKDIFDDDFARLFGYLTGDGYVRFRKTTGLISFTNNSQELLDDFARLIKKVFNLEVSKRKKQNSNSYEYYISSIDLVRILSRIEPNIVKKSGDMCIPEMVSKSPNYIIKEFLKSLFDCEGYVNNQKRVIEFSSKSKELIYDIKYILLRFGILSQISSGMKYASNTKNRIRRRYYRLRISGEELINFYKEIGFVTVNKNKKLERWVKENKNYNTDLNVVPNLKDLLKILRKKYDLSQFDFDIKRTTYQHYEKGDRFPSYEKLQKIYDKYLKLNRCDPLIEILRQISRADIFWDKIKKIVTVENEDSYVYDLEIDNVHNFVANGVMVHNSQLLKRVSKIAPKARFVSGKGVSGAGLTAAVVRDEFLNGWSLEAGALPLANNGFCMIDEMDKMSPEDTSAMHEALEGQTITISKANIQATLRCETTVLAAANPKFGRFDPYDIIAKQINMPPALINRFDLIFPIKDLPDKTKDNLLADHILKLHQAPDTDAPEIDTDLLKKYISYVRQRATPKLSNEAMEELKKYYVEMRNSGSEEGSVKSVPISARQLEALVRLSEACAKLRLGEEVTKKDAKRGIEMLHYCLSQIGIDPETGKIDIDRIATGISSSQRSHIITVKEIITELENKIGKTIPIDDVVSEAKAKGIEEDKVEEVLEKLKRSGDIFEPRRGFVQKI